MAIERKYDLGSLYELFEGRCPSLADQPHVQKVDLKLEKNELIHLAVDDMGKVVHLYDEVKKGDPRNSIRKNSFMTGEWRELHSARLSGNSRIHCVARKGFGRMNDNFPRGSGAYPPHYAGEEMESIVFEIFNGEEEIGGYRLDRDLTPNSNAWALNDRLVLDIYREQGFGAILFSAAESFVRNYADQDESPQKITASVGQPSVLLMMLNKGFSGSTEEDRRRIEMVLAGDPNLELDYAIIWVEIFDEAGKPTGQFRWETETFKDPYVFTKSTVPKTEVNAFRINLEKVFEPKNTAVSGTQAAVKSKLGDVENF